MLDRDSLCPRNMGYLASATRFVGTIMVNVDAADEMMTGETWHEAYLLLWMPNVVDRVCFLVATCFAYTEVFLGAASFAPRSVSCWIAVVSEKRRSPCASS